MSVCCWYWVVIIYIIPYVKCGYCYTPPIWWFYTLYIYYVAFQWCLASSTHYQWIVCFLDKMPVCLCFYLQLINIWAWFGCPGLWPIMWWHKRGVLGESSVGHSTRWAQIIKMAASEEVWKTFVFDDYLTTPQTNIDNVCCLLCCRWYFSHFQLNCITDGDSGYPGHFPPFWNGMARDFLPGVLGLAQAITHLGIKW